ncbi:MAG TPA: Trm112 family protein [Turneriella sp.]|nr:Trm112 family protein [Turneriella sp.]HMY11659.1 Trm112 family protein [Turneriella sp.]HNA78420.1 Trm112 family protein [Turneriella sp.]HNE19629.1 Trm112 family protein [Turneriella sp.]HNJ65046.1 Trm112 family protein [Turneriella sp.]
MSPELLEILVCPRTKKKLQIADTAVLERVNALIKSGKCKEVSGAQVSEPATAGLYEPENQTFYFIREDIPVLVYDNAVRLG